MPFARYVVTVAHLLKRFSLVTETLNRAGWSFSLTGGLQKRIAEIVVAGAPEILGI